MAGTIEAPPRPQVDMATHVPSGALAPYVNSIVGYRLRGFEPGLHLGLPSRSLTAVISFDDPIRVATHEDGRIEVVTNEVMASGLHHQAVDIRHNGNQHGIQIDFTPLGARALFGLPAGRLGVGGEPLAALWGETMAAELYERTASAETWAERFGVVEALLTEALRRNEFRAAGTVGGPHQAALDSWAILCASNGRIGIAELADELGWSRRLITARFTDEYGLTPKAMAKVLRFQRAVELLKATPTRSLGDVAAVCGYADQAHFTREWRRITRTTPTAWLRDEVFPIVQDADHDDERRSAHD